MSRDDKLLQQVGVVKRKYGKRKSLQKGMAVREYTYITGYDTLKLRITVAEIFARSVPDAGQG